MLPSWLSYGLLAGAASLLLYTRWIESSELTPLVELKQGASYHTLTRRLRYRGGRKAKAAKRRIREARDVVACAKGSRKQYPFRIGHAYILENAKTDVTLAEILHVERTFNLWKYISLLLLLEREIFGIIILPLEGDVG